MTTNIESMPSHRLRPKILAFLAGSAVVAIGAGGFLSTTALFTDEVTIGPNSVAAATLTVETETVAMAVTDLLPGVAGTQKVIEFDNTGSVPARYSVSVEAVTSTAAVDDKVAILGWFDVTITSGTVTETGTLAALPDLLNAGVFSAGTSGEATITVTLNSNATDLAQGATAGFNIVIDAKQIVPE
ncbi:hypothetical protein [Cryobacterium sp. TMT1-66-1]|uniref:hypothetical protein n=1 Tax=Cryobacterium sp. TMT1-66-1 TaxID=1259242 RepID=UPI00106C3D44|nr:hypothetical protein [Cryobacterium sp. TMT1-66-1]TFD06529.1 hypothetical protein E3T29_09640 [Cryobacterium sp. TMT1-66-1]